MKFPKPTKKKKRINLFSKEKTWWQTAKELDRVVSIAVRNRDGWRCRKCRKQHEKGSNSLTCSHFFKRDYKGARWEMDNLDSLCWFPCHVQSEKDKQNWYMDYMLEKLGVNGYKILKIKALSTTKFSKQDLELLIKIYQNQ